MNPIKNTCVSIFIILFISCSSSTDDSDLIKIEEPLNYYSSGDLLVNNNISALFDRSLDVYGVRLLVAGNVGGQPAVPDEWAKKQHKYLNY